jgi:hypothetical protein
MCGQRDVWLVAALLAEQPRCEVAGESTRADILTARLQE